MDFDALLTHAFGTTEIANLEPQTLMAGVERLRTDFGTERDSGRRFALWALLHMLGAAPDLEDAFPDPTDRDAARDLMDALDAEDAD